MQRGVERLDTPSGKCSRRNRGERLMADFVILTDSTCDLLPEVAEKYDIRVAMLSVLLDGNVYKNYLDGRELSFKDLFDSMRNKKLPTTSAVNVTDFMELMEPDLQAGKDILYIGFSAIMSGTYNAGCVAAKELLEKYPERKILTVDTKCATLGEGLIAELCAIERDKGKTIEETYEFAIEHSKNIRHMFTVDDLFHLVRGGRATKATAIIGSMLGIKPLLNVNTEGKVDAYAKARGRKKAFKMIVEDAKQHVLDKDIPFYIAHGDDFEGAEVLAKLIRDEVGCTDVRIGYLGAVCGCHGGPDLVGAFYLGNGGRE